MATITQDILMVRKIFQIIHKVSTILAHFVRSFSISLIISKTITASKGNDGHHASSNQGSLKMPTAEA
jgi:hypothetical protein